MAAGKFSASLELAPEASFGSLAASSFSSIDVSALTFQACEVAMDSTAFGSDGRDEMAYQTEMVTGAIGGELPEVETMFSVSTPQQRMTGTFSFRFPWRSSGAGTAHTSTWLHHLLASSMDSVTEPVNTAMTITGGTAGSPEVSSVDGGTVSVGQVVAYDYLGTSTGRREYSRVTSITTVGPTATLTLFPALPAAPAASELLRLCHTYVPVVGAPAGASLAFRSRTTTYSWVATGCRLESLSISQAGGPSGKTMEAVATVRATLVQQITTGSVTALVLSQTGKRVQHFASCSSTADFSAVSAPVTAARTSLQCGQWGAEIAFALVPNISSADIRGATGMDVGTPTCTVSPVLDPGSNGSDYVSFVDGRRLARWQPLVVAANGPLTAGNGMAVMLNRMSIDAMPAMAMERDTSLFTPTLSAASYAGDAASAAVTRNKPWCLALVA